MIETCSLVALVFVADQVNKILPILAHESIRNGWVKN
jgi:hypothetical protein